MRICFVGDNRVRPNFGCRATSIALRDIVARHHEISSTISGEMTEMYRPNIYKDLQSLSKITSYVQRVYKRLFACKDDADFVTDDAMSSVHAFLNIYHKYRPLQLLYEKISQADALVLNAEGTFIFRQKPRYDLNFYLFIITLAQSLGKKSYVLNAMFSDGTASQRNMQTIQQASCILSKCTLVTARDALSYQYYKEHIGTNVTYIPDALFSWTKYSAYIPLAISYPHAGITFPESVEQWQEFDFSKPYIAVSAASREMYTDDMDSIKQYTKLVEILKKNYRVVIVQTCMGESFLWQVALQTNTKIIDVRTNILFGMSVLANAQCYISGRWHPSILASLGGTPCVMLSSNSHKSAAIYKELRYDSISAIYSNPPTDDDIMEIVKRVEFCVVHCPRQTIQENAQKNSMLLKQYENLLK